ncbi:MAG: phytoene/squalene synthase family protein [Cryomorphaceae bacterium]|nr:MAG: phytoene/squalene synthase family protein [Cryomorphaceae bacterium]
MSRQRDLYDDVCLHCSKLTTNKYSTSFSLGIRFLHRDFHLPIYGIYGFVRFADEIVDTFHEHNKRELLDRFKADTYRAIEEKISLNPILHSFQLVVNKYHIERELIDTFLHSMELDLSEKNYDEEGYKEYIDGSAEVVGLMCLRVFLEGDVNRYDDLKHYARRLGSAFQKINFLRDLKADYQIMGRTYFPGVEMGEFNDAVKKEIEVDVQKDFDEGLTGIRMLPKKSRFGVYVAYVYYQQLFNKVKRTPASVILTTRIRISNKRKYLLFLTSYLRHQLNMI